MKCKREVNTQEFRLLNWNKITPSTEGVVFWHVVNVTQDFAKSEVISSFQKVFDVWQRIFDEIDPKGRVIQFEKTASFSDAHIKLLFVNPFRKSQKINCLDGSSRRFKIPKQFDGVGGTLAYVPKNTHMVFFDEGERWDKMTDMTDMEISLFDVALHELGHVFDLAHSNVRGAVMEAYYDGTSKDIHPDDVKGLQRAYGKIKKDVANGSL